MLGGRVKKYQITFLIMIAIFLAVYLIAAFFLKSEYPLSSHLFSGRDAYNVLKDALGLVSPFLLAYIIYQIWHSQKGKEVVASEAKSLIKGLFEEMALISNLVYSTPKTKEDLVDSVGRLEVLIKNNLRSALYIKGCLDDMELKTTLSKYQENSSQIFALLRGNMRGIDRISFMQRVRIIEPKLRDYMQLVEASAKSLKPYSLYQIDFKFKE